MTDVGGAALLGPTSLWILRWNILHLVHQRLFQPKIHTRLVMLFDACRLLHFDAAERAPNLPIANVRFGSKADIGLAPVDVRFIPESGH
jgi:hypothetical protein